MTTLTVLQTTEDLIRQCLDQTHRRGGDGDRLLDLPALACAVGRRLREAGIPVTPWHSEQYARSLELAEPGSRTALYWTTRAIFLTGTDHAATFDRVFHDIFGAPEPGAAVTAI